MFYLDSFTTEQAFNEGKKDLVEPWVALTEDDNNVHYTQYYEMVDLGLPSGLKWAKCNIGAESETDYGLYFQWGDVVGYSDASHSTWSTAPFNNGSSSFDSSYFTAHKSEWLDGEVLKPQYDAATQIMGSQYRMPTKADWDELLSNTTNELVQVNGVKGRRFTASNGNSIFIPMSGYATDDLIDETDYNGNVWSSSHYTNTPNSAWLLGFDSDDCAVTWEGHSFGLNVRGVQK